MDSHLARASWIVRLFASAACVAAASVNLVPPDAFSGTTGCLSAGSARQARAKRTGKKNRVSGFMNLSCGLREGSVCARHTSPGNVRDSDQLNAARNQRRQRMPAAHFVENDEFADRR